MTDSVITELVVWGESQADIRAMILTSTRAIDGAFTDRFSDNDVILITTNVPERHSHRDWLQDFGEVVIDWWDPLERDPDTGLVSSGNIVYYPGTKKIDFGLWSIEQAEMMEHQLTTELDAGYRVLLDKDKLTANWQEPTGVGYAIALPDCDTYAETVNGFLIGVPYVVTALLRGEILPAKWVLDYDMRYEYLLPMLEWYAVVLHGSDIRIGNNGKGLQKYLPEKNWLQLQQASAGMNISENRLALRAILRLFHDVAEPVGRAIGCRYPAELHNRVTTHVAALEASKE